LICCAATSIYATETTESKSDGNDLFSGTQPAASDRPTIRPILTDIADIETAIEAVLDDTIIDHVENLH
jgi:hypothetical protein